MFVTTNNKLGFIHIPKCGGTSVYRAFAGENNERKQDRSNPWSAWPIYEAHTKWRTVYPHKSDKEKLGKVFPGPETWFTTVRNPYARFHTWYHYQREWDRKRYVGELPRKGLSVKDLEFRMEFFDTHSPKQVLKLIPELLQQGNIWKYAVSNISNPQWHWVVGCPNLQVFKLERIDRMWQWLHNQGCMVQPTHVKKNTAKTGSWETDFDEETIVLIQQLYEKDFKKLSYELVVT